MERAVLGIGSLDLHFPVRLGGVDGDVTIGVGAVLLVTVDVQHPGVGREGAA